MNSDSVEKEMMAAIKAHLAKKALDDSELLRDRNRDAKSFQMSDAPSRELLDAKLAAAEARTETRLVAVDAKLDRLTDLLTGPHGVLSELKEVKADNRNTRWTVIAVFIGSVLAGLAALWTTQSNLLSAFQAVLAAHPPH